MLCFFVAQRFSILRTYQNIPTHSHTLNTQSQIISMLFSVRPNPITHLCAWVWPSWCGLSHLHTQRMQHIQRTRDASASVSNRAEKCKCNIACVRLCGCYAVMLCVERVCAQVCSGYCLFSVEQRRSCLWALSAPAKDGFAYHSQHEKKRVPVLCAISHPRTIIITYTHNIMCYVICVLNMVCTQFASHDAKECAHETVANKIIVNHNHRLIEQCSNRMV